MTLSQRNLKISRDTVLFVTGLLLTMNEALIRSGPERPFLLAMFAGMMGLPIFLGVDEKKAKTPPPPEVTPPATAGETREGS